MSKLLIAAIIFMTLALTFYTIGVFGEKKKGVLMKWHVLVFWMGFICDTTQPACNNRPDCPSLNGISCRLGGSHTCKKQ